MEFVHLYENLKATGRGYFRSLRSFSSMVRLRTILHYLSGLMSQPLNLSDLAVPI